MTKYIDQMGRTVELQKPLQRIISLVPSQTELLYSLGLGDRVVGITKFCVHPQVWFRSKVRVGGTKNVHFDKIAALKPDLIIGNKEENDKEMMEVLMKHYPVWMSDIFNLEDAYQMMKMLGEITATADKANTIVQQIKTNFQHLKPTPTMEQVAYFIWKDPLMVVGQQTFIHQMLVAAGFDNVFQYYDRYPEIEPQTLAKANPKFIFLSSEPYPFKAKHIDFFQKICPLAKVIIVDGELFSWYGSRLLKSATYLSALKNELIIS